MIDLGELQAELQALREVEGAALAYVPYPAKSFDDRYMPTRQALIAALAGVIKVRRARTHAPSCASFDFDPEKQLGPNTPCDCVGEQCGNLAPLLGQRCTLPRGHEDHQYVDDGRVVAGWRSRAVVDRQLETSAGACADDDDAVRDAAWNEFVKKFGADLGVRLSCPNVEPCARGPAFEALRVAFVSGWAACAQTRAKMLRSNSYGKAAMDEPVKVVDVGGRAATWPTSSVPTADDANATNTEGVDDE